MAISVLINKTLTAQATVPSTQQRLGVAEGLYNNDHFTLVVKVGGLPSGVTVAKAYLTVKQLPTDADPGIVQKAITSAAVTGTGQITDTGSSSSMASLQFDLVPADTILLTALSQYAWDVQWIDQQGLVHTAIGDSTLIAGQGVTAAVS